MKTKFTLKAITVLAVLFLIVTLAPAAFADAENTEQPVQTADDLQPELPESNDLFLQDEVQEDDLNGSAEEEEAEEAQEPAAQEGAGAEAREADRTEADKDGGDLRATGNEEIEEAYGSRVVDQKGSTMTKTDRKEVTVEGYLLENGNKVLVTRYYIDGVLVREERSSLFPAPAEEEKELTQAEPEPESEPDEDDLPDGTGNEIPDENQNEDPDGDVNDEPDGDENDEPDEDENDEYDEDENDEPGEDDNDEPGEDAGEDDNDEPGEDDNDEPGEDDNDEPGEDDNDEPDEDESDESDQDDNDEPDEGEDDDFDEDEQESNQVVSTDTQVKVEGTLIITTTTVVLKDGTTMTNIVVKDVLSNKTTAYTITVYPDGTIERAEEQPFSAEEPQATDEEESDQEAQIDKEEEKAFLDAMDIFKARLAKVTSAIGDPDRVALVFRTGMLCLNDMQEILDRAERQGLDFMHSKNAYSFSDRKFPLSAEESFKVLDTSLGLWEEELHLNREKVMGGSTEDESLFKQAIKNLFISVPTGTP